MSQRIYLDNNASTFIDPRVADLLIHTIQEPIGNPSSIHSYGRKSRNQLVSARDSIALSLGVKPSNLIFTSGATEGINLTIRGLLANKKSGHIITSTAEHSCVYSTIKEMEKMGFQATYLSPDLWGAVKPEAVRAAIRPDTCLITLMAVNNETGVKTDIESVAAIASEMNILFVVDGVALLGKESFVIASGVSAMSFSGHKCHAPQGVGVTYLRSGLKLTPLSTGGEQELGRRSGTENVLGILALAKAFELLAEELPKVTKQMLFLRDRFENILQDALPGVNINGQGDRTVNVSNLSFSGVDGETLLMTLDASLVSASHGSACSSGALEPSRVLLSMGLPLEQVRSSLRFSLSRMTTEDEIDRACDVIIKIVQQIRQKQR